MPGATADGDATIRTVTRIFSHAAIWVAVLVPTIVILSKGWIAVDDDAAIAIRAFQTFSLHPPLVGMYSTAANVGGRAIYDPGPLLFWLLAVPVRIDAARGLLWGAALFGGAVLSLTVEAIVSTAAWLGALLIPVLLFVLLADWPGVYENLAWNAYFPIPFLVAAIGLAWVLTTGSFGWWPVLVFAGSVAAQCHLIFSLPSVALVVLSPCVALLLGFRPRRWRWLVVGLLVALACWVAPIAQSFGPQGNLGSIATTDHGRQLGLSFGLKMLATAGSPSPIWAKDAPSNFYAAIALVEKSSVIGGVAVLVLLAGAMVFAVRTGRRSLGGLTAVSAIVSLCLVVTFAVYPAKNVLNLGYLVPILWIVGVLVWTAIGCSIAAAFVDVRRHVRHPETDPQVTSNGLRWKRIVVALCIAVVAVGALIGIPEITGFVPTTANSLGTVPLMDSVSRATRTIERDVPRGPIDVRVSDRGGGYLSALSMTEGIDWQLEADHWTPGTTSIERAFTFLAPVRGARQVVVSALGDVVQSVTVLPCRYPALHCEG